ncbi:hypothetical protein LRP52_48145 [Photobacterium sp. ZSDE20]|nr:hypothetical protein [Photobacterium sp. ZSDE20]
MRELNKNEVLTVDGGGERGGGDRSGNHGGNNQSSRNSNSSKDQGEIWGGSLACGLCGMAVGAITKNGTLGLAAGTICSGIAGNLDHGSSENSSPNHNGGAYHGHAGGMDGSSTGFGR